MSFSSRFPRAAVRGVIYLGAILFATHQLVPAARAGSGLNGFDLCDSSIPVERIEAGGPPRDGIPALVMPITLAVAGAGYLAPDDRVRWPLHDSLGGTPLRLYYAGGARAVRITDKAGRALSAIPAYWFAWAAFYPQTAVFDAPE